MSTSAGRHIHVHDAPVTRPHPRSATRVAQASKPERLRQLVAELPAGSRTIVFCNTKIKCESLAREFRSAGTCAIHGDKDQQQREYALQQFTRGRCPMMFATDVAARGLDIKGVTNVINLDMPQGDDGVESYVHRIGLSDSEGLCDSWEPSRNLLGTFSRLQRLEPRGPAREEGLPRRPAARQRHCGRRLRPARQGHASRGRPGRLSDPSA